MNENLSVYISIPIKFCNIAYKIEQRLRENGFEVFNPCKIIPRGVPQEELPYFIATECWRLIDESSIIVAYMDYYGRDCAAEMGYGIARGKLIFPISFSGDLTLLNVDWMIKPFVQVPSTSLEELVDKITLYVKAFVQVPENLW